MHELIQHYTMSFPALLVFGAFCWLFGIVTVMVLVITAGDRHNRGIGKRQEREKQGDKPF